MSYITNHAKLYKLNMDDSAYRGRIIKDILEEYSASDLLEIELWNRYNQVAGSLPIHDRTKNDTAKALNKVDHDFRGEIVDHQTSYFVGQPISYNVAEEVGEALQLKFKDFIKHNRMSAQDKFLAKRTAVCGKAGRLFYLDADKMLFRFVNLHKWEYKVVRDNVTGEPLFAIRYYEVERTDGKIKRQVEFYDALTVQHFAETENGDFVPDYYNLDLPEMSAVEGQRETRYSHGFTKVPVIEFENNEEQKGDFQKVENLIDAYDLVVSLDLDDIEELRDAYLVLINSDLSDPAREALKESNLISLIGDGVDAKYVTKNINPEKITRSLDRLKQNIYRLSKTVDFSDESFSGGGESGESRKYKIMNMDNKRLDKVASFEYGLQQQFELVMTGWLMLHGISFDPDLISYEFTPNIPMDYKYWAEVAALLAQTISKRSILDILPSNIVDDTQAELERIEEEKTLSLWEGYEPPAPEEEEQEDEAE